jgi:hypothetical protein
MRDQSFDRDVALSCRKLDTDATKKPAHHKNVYKQGVAGEI